MDKKAFSTKYVDVLDGVRAISVIIVLIFHFWQQTWIFPVIKTPFLSFIGIHSIDFTPFARVGYLFVDMMVLISGFLLFLPVARNVFYGEPLSKWRDYYKKRAVRILPSYVFCVLALFIYELASGGYGAPADVGRALTDLFAHLTFTHMWKVETYLSTKLNVVLWTLAVEVWFYVIFPLFAMIIKRRKKEKKPVKSVIRAVLTAVVMVGVSFIYIYLYVLQTGGDFSNGVDAFLRSLGSGIRSNYLSMVINQLPAFMGTYAVGLIGALLYVWSVRIMNGIYENQSRKYVKWIVSAVFTALSVLFIHFIVQMITDCSHSREAQVWQITERLPLALIFMGFVICAAFSFKWFRWLFSNRLMRFLSIISYNLYIWHQWLCVKLKNDWRFPQWPAYPIEGSPNTWTAPECTAEQVAAGQDWSASYALVITIAAFAAAILATYLIERPAADLLNGKKSIYNGKLKLLWENKKNRK